MDLRREPVFEAEPRRSAPTLAEFARKSQITEDKVWELIEDGQVAARFVNDTILIMQEGPQVENPAPEPVEVKKTNPLTDPRYSPELLLTYIDRPTAAKDEAKKPRKPLTAPAQDAEEKSSQANETTEQNNDLLIFAQDSLNRNAELTRELLATKDELVRLKDERIAFLLDQLQEKEREIRLLNRKVDELMTLSKFEQR